MNKQNNYHLIFLTILIVNLSTPLPHILAQTGPLNGSGGGIIAFISNRAGSEEIYLMNANGSAQTRVTNNSAFEFDVSWSPDGNRLAFCSNLQGGFDIYIMDVIDITTATFSDPVRITNDPALEMSLSWSPDGSRIVYSGPNGITIMDADGRNVSYVNTSPVAGQQPSWSPNGDRLAIVSQQGLYTIGIDGSNLQQLTSTSALVPEWSPDGNKIAYVATEAAEDIFIINNDGTNNRRITTNPDNDFVPSWSPDGTRIVYEGSINGNDEICVIDTNGENYKRLTNVGTNTGPCWRPIQGSSSVHDENSAYVTLDGFALYQNYPNPFNPSTTVRYSITGKFTFLSKVNVNLKVFDILGKEVATLVNEEQSPGNYQIEFSAGDLSSGVYFYRLAINNFSQTKKMLFLQ